ncbi:MAG: fimbrillin family protein [Bacteroidales bacterium]|nr:fimbrillin family protein [Bacteroidales bacterium]
MRSRTIISAISVVLALAFTSCAKIERYVNVNEQLGYEESSETVDFSWYTSRAITTKANPTYFVGDVAATGTERHLNSGTSMGVFGYFHPQTSGGAAGTWNTSAGAYNTPNLFYNEPVSITESAGNYTYDYVHSRFWPRNKLDRISFIAYYPWNELNTSGAATDETIVEPFLDVNSVRQGMVGFYYVVPAKSEDQVDFMVSDLCLEQSKAVWSDNHALGLTGNSNGKVKFFFHHALSQIRVKSVNFDTGGNDKVELKINYIVFRNVAVFGQCIPVPDFGSADATGRVPVTPSWPTGTLVGRRPDLTSGVTADVCYDSSTDTWDVNKFLLMIPHTFFTNASIEVNFDVTRKKNGTGEYYSYTGNTLSAPLTTTSVYEWQAGKIYTYNITLDLKQIKVTADVVDWLDAGDDVIMDN